MAGPERRFVKATALLVALVWFLATTSVPAGMAELGKKRKFRDTEATTGIDDGFPAGGADATLTVSGISFVEPTVATETVSNLLVRLSDQANAAPGLTAMVFGGTCAGGLLPGVPCFLSEPTSACTLFGACSGGVRDGTICELGNATDGCLTGGGTCGPTGGTCVADDAGVCSGGTQDGLACDLDDPLDICFAGGGACHPFGICKEGTEHSTACELGATNSCVSSGGTCFGTVEEIDLPDTDIGISTTDPGLEFVRVSALGRVAFPQVTSIPAGGFVEIIINGEIARAATVITDGLSAFQLNAALVAELAVQGFDARLAGDNIEITYDFVADAPVMSGSWEDDDPGIASIGGAVTICGAGAVSDKGVRCCTANTGDSTVCDAGDSWEASFFKPDQGGNLSGFDLFRFTSANLLYPILSGPGIVCQESDFGASNPVGSLVTTNETGGGLSVSAPAVGAVHYYLVTHSRTNGGGVLPAGRARPVPGGGFASRFMNPPCPL